MCVLHYRLGKGCACVCELDSHYCNMEKKICGYQKQLLQVLERTF
jgi:hypothetical protein